MGPGWRAPSAALVGGSVALFGVLRRAALALPRPAAVRSRPGRVWRWRNLLVSFAHSVLAGLWALFRYRAPRWGGSRDTVHTLRTGIGAPGLRWSPRGRRHGVRCSGSPCLPFPAPWLTPSPRPPLLASSLWHSPELLSDIQDGYSVSGHLLVCFSSGKEPGRAMAVAIPLPLRPRPARWPGMSPRLKGRATLRAACLNHKHGAHRLPGPSRLPTLNWSEGVSDAWSTVTPPSSSLLLPLTLAGDGAQARPPQCSLSSHRLLHP